MVSSLTILYMLSGFAEGKEFNPLRNSNGALILLHISSFGELKRIFFLLLIQLIEYFGSTYLRAVIQPPEIQREVVFDIGVGSCWHIISR